MPTCIYWLNGKELVGKIVEKTYIDSLYVSIITIAELYFGAYNSEYVEYNIKKVCDFASCIKSVSLDLDISSKNQTQAEIFYLLTSVESGYTCQS